MAPDQSRPMLKGLDCLTDRQLQDLLEAAKARADTRLILEFTAELYRRHPAGTSDREA